MALLQWRRDDSGASAVEYGLLLAGIAVVIFAAVFLFGTKVTGMFEHNCDSLAKQLDGTTSCTTP